MELQCGQIEGPLDAQAPSGPRIRIHFAVAPARAARKLADPVTFIAGGPGQSAIQLAGAFLAMYGTLQNRRDLVFVDQRGTGQSAPLQCTEDESESLAQLADLSRAQEKLRACRRKLQALPHGDLRHYSTDHAVADLDAVRERLGADQWNLIGGSYGTRVGLAYQQRYPQRVRRLVLDGMAPFDMVLPLSFGYDTQAALDASFRACEEDDRCRRRHPDLKKRWMAWLDGLPKTVQVRHPRTAQIETVRLSREMALALVRRPLYAPSAAAVIPAALESAMGGDLAGLLGLSGLGAGSSAARLAAGMHYSVICAEDMPRVPGALTELNAFQRMDLESYRQACAGWPIAQAARLDVPISKATNPVLLLSGGDDPATPPRHAEQIRSRLGGQAVHLTVPHAGHGVLGLPCVRDAAMRFVQAEEQDALRVKGLECAARMPRARIQLAPKAVAASAPTGS